MSNSGRSRASCIKTGLVLGVIGVCGVTAGTSATRGQGAAPAPAPAAEPAPAAPQYAALTVNDQLSRLERGTIRRLLQGSDPFVGPAVGKFDEFFRTFFFAKMTQPDQLHAIPELRDNLAKHFQTARRNKEVTEHLNDLTYRLMYGICVGPRRALNAQGKGATVIAVGRQLYTLTGQSVPMERIDRFAATSVDFHPAVKYNAMLIIGELNDKAPTNNSKAVPRGKALLPLLGVAESAKRKWPDSQRVAALIGVQRHCQVVQQPEEGKKLIAAALINVMNERTPAGRSLQGDVWIRRQAIDILAELAVPGADNAVIKSLARVVGNQNVALPLRAAAANALGQIPLNGLPAGGAQVLAKGLGGLAVAACRFEISGGADGRETPSRSRLTSNLHAVQTALSGPATGAPGQTGLVAVAQAEDKVLVTRLAADVQRIMGVASQSSAADETFKLALDGSIRQLNATLAGKAAGAAPAPGGVPSPF